MKISWKSVLSGAAAAAAAAALAWFATQRGPLAPVTVETATAATAELRRSIFGIGTVEARYAYAIGPTQAGRVLRVHVDHGDAVTEGQLLAEIDPVDLEQRLAAAAAAERRARHARVAAEALVNEAQSRHRLAVANARRYRDLEQRNFISHEAVEIRANEAEVARAAVNAAEAGLRSAREDVARARKEREALAMQLSNLRLESPVDGVVVAREAEAGNTVVAGQAIVRIIDPASLWVRARIDQSRAAGLAPGLPAEIVLRSAPSDRHAGRVARVELQSDAVTEERIVAVAFALPVRVPLGELAEVTIYFGDGARALAVPSAAVKRRNGGEGVWQVIDGRARFRAVRTGARTLEGMTEVRDGLEAGEPVVVYSGAELREGMRVRIGKTS